MNVESYHNSNGLNTTKNWLIAVFVVFVTKHTEFYGIYECRYTRGQQLNSARASKSFFEAANKLVIKICFRFFFYRLSATFYSQDKKKESHVCHILKVENRENCVVN